jgi:excisionase family DNA binding protein
MEKLLSVSETAEILNIKVSTVRAWLALRKLPRVSVGRCVRVPLTAVQELIAKNTIPARERR